VDLAYWRDDVAPALRSITRPAFNFLLNISRNHLMTNFKLAVRMGLALFACGAGAAAQADTIAEWNFGTLASTAPDNTPAATNGTQAANSATTGTSVGMANNYAQVGYPNGSPYTFDDITADTNSTIGNGNVWRLRGSSTAATQSGANGWSTNAPEYAQGAQFTTTTAGENNIVLSFNWASTAQGIANMQVQYNTNVNNSTGWTSVGSLLTATVGNSSTGGSYQTDTINFGTLGITSVNNDATFGVRLVAAYNPNLAGGTEYASASSVISGSPAEYNNTSGNWRFADVQIDGTAIAPVPLPASAWLMLSGLGGFGWLARRRKTISA
jgi:hypothetical protein